MTDRNYWLDLFTGSTWREFKDAGACVSGFRESRWGSVQKISKGDVFLCYLTGISRFIGILEVTSDPFQDETPIWKEDLFPCRMKVRLVSELTPETAVPIASLREQLSIFRDLEGPSAWTGHVRGSPALWDPADGEIIVRAVAEAARNPVKRPVDPKKLGYRPKALVAAHTSDIAAISILLSRPRAWSPEALVELRAATSSPTFPSTEAISTSFPSSAARAAGHRPTAPSTRSCPSFFKPSTRPSQHEPEG